MIAEDGLSIDLIDRQAAPLDGQAGPVVVGRIGAPGAIDAKDNGTANTDVRTAIVRPDDTTLPKGVSEQMVKGLGKSEVLLVYSIESAWLDAPERSFPVTLDPTVCLRNGSAGCLTSYLDTYIGDGWPNSYVTSHGWNRVGTDTQNPGWGHIQTLMYFGSVPLNDQGSGSDDAAQVLSAKLEIRQKYNKGDATGTIVANRVTKSWNEYATWNGMASAYSTLSADTASVAPCGSGSTICSDFLDVTTIVRQWYTSRAADWKQNLGFMLRRNPQTKGEIGLFYGIDATVSRRPKLTITYVTPHVQMEFAPELGAYYAPSAMPAGQTTYLPVKVTNNGSGFSFNSTADAGGWRYALGYRWFDAKGNLAGSSTTPTAFSADIASGATGGPYLLPVAAPTAVGSYTLRLDVVHIKGTSCSSGACLWASDWADPVKYLERDKRDYDPANTRWTGNSFVERAEFGIAVRSGGGTNAGLVKSITLGDGSVASVNMWSSTLHYDGSGGVGFSDIIPVGLGYQYDSGNVATCSQILGACGWSTNFDERLSVTSDPNNFTYQDPAGNVYFMGTDANGQITGGPGSMQRVRYTLLDDNRHTWDSMPLFDTSNPYVGSISYRVTGTGTANASITPNAPVNRLSHLYFSVRGTSTTNYGGMGVQVKNTKTAVSAWFGYWFGPSSSGWSMAGMNHQIYMGTNSAGWRSYDTWLWNDVRVHPELFGTGASDDDEFVVTTVRMAGGSAGFNWFDGIYLAPHPSTLIADALPAFVSGGSYASLNTADKAAGSASVQVAPVDVASSPSANFTDTEKRMSTYPFIRWSWRKVGGTTIAVSFTVKDVRVPANTGTVIYYSGEYKTEYGDHAIPVSTELPGAWTTVTRNVEEDARQLLGFYDDPTTSSPSAPPSRGPVPDELELVSYKLIARDGEYGLFDETYLLTQSGIEKVISPGTEDFVLTNGDGSQHYFNLDGLLERIVDRNGNAVNLDYTYNYGTNGPTAYTLTGIRAAGDGMALSSGTAQRELVVTRGTGWVRFSEQLGSTTSFSGRYTEFQVAGSDLTAVIPARRSAACASGGATGCVKFTYTGSHLLNRVYDPRSTGTDSNYAQVTYTGTAPQKITDASRSEDLLIVNNYAVGGSSYRRVLWQDAAALNAQMAFYTDLSPDGSTLREYQPLGCIVITCTPSLERGHGSGGQIRVRWSGPVQQGDPLPEPQPRAGHRQPPRQQRRPGGRQPVQPARWRGDALEPEPRPVLRVGEGRLALHQSHHVQPERACRVQQVPHHLHLQRPASGHRHQDALRRPDWQQRRLQHDPDRLRLQGQPHFGQRQRLPGEPGIRVQLDRLDLGYRRSRDDRGQVLGRRLACPDRQRDRGRQAGSKPAARPGLPIPAAGQGRQRWPRHLQARLPGGHQLGGSRGAPPSSRRPPGRHLPSTRECR